MNKRFVQDDDGHWYLIPADEQDLFEIWVMSMELFAGQSAPKDYDV